MKNLFIFILSLFLIPHGLPAQDIPTMEPNQTVNGKKEGKWITWLDQSFLETNIKDSVAYYKEILFEAGEPIEEMKIFYDSGELWGIGRLISADPDILDGKSVLYYKNGQPSSEAYYKNGLLEGELIDYYENGQINTIGNYKNNQLNGKLIGYHENGQIRSEGSYKNGLLEGELTIYHPNGQTHSKGNYTKGLMNGEFVNYYETGNTQFISNYTMGEPSGIWISYNEDGSIEFKKNYALHDQENISLEKIKKAKEYEEAKDYLNALKYSKEALVYAKNELGEEHLDYALSLSALGPIYWKLGDYENALSAFKELLVITEKTQGKNHKDYGDISYSISLLYADLEDYKQALHFNIQALENAEKNFGINSDEYLMRLESRGLLYKDIGNFSQAVQIFEQVLEEKQRENRKINESYMYSLTHLGDVRNSMGDYTAALTHYTEALGIFEALKGKDHSDYGNRLNSIASVYESLGDYSKALKFFNEALENAKIYQGENHPDYSRRLNNLSNLYFTLGDYEKALKYITEAYEITQNNPDANSLELNTQLNNLAMAYKELGNHSEALRLLREALENAEKVHGKQHPSYATYLNNLGTYFYSLGEYEQARSYLEETVEIIESTLGKEHPDYSLYLSNLSVNYDKMGNYEEALKGYKEALGLFENSLGKEHPYYGNMLVNIATLYRLKNEYSRAYPLYSESKSNLEKQINHVFAFLPETGKEHFVNRHNNEFHKYRSFFMDYHSENKNVSGDAYDLELLAKGMILDSSIDLQKRISESDDPQLAIDFSELVFLKNKLANEYNKAFQDRNPSLAEWEETAERLEGEINRRTNLLSDMQQIGDTTWKEVQNSLKNNEVAIEFSSFPYHNGFQMTDTVQYMALILRKEDKQPKLIPLFTQNQLDEITKTTGGEENRINTVYRGSIVVTAKKDHGKLYNLLWKPIEEYLNEGETIYIAPVGTLHQISFSAIKNSEGKFLSDLYDLKQVSSTARLLNQSEEFNLHKIALFGGINYDADFKTDVASNNQKNHVSTGLPEDLDLRSLTSGNRGWSYLKGTKDEIDAIENLAKKEPVSILLYTENLAAEENFKNLNGDNSPEVLHIATHGFFFPNPEKSMNTDNLKNNETNVFKLSDNPLNRAGLLFAGANRIWRGEKPNEGMEDGVLTAYEASQVYLPNTELVVLSACETGLGEIKGSEGVFGLQRAFKSAGAKYLLMSLWKVPDKETAEFMEEFYRELFDSQNIESSYKKAQTMMKDKYPNGPFKWAAFVLMR